MSVYEERVGRNEAIFREVNERIADLEEQFSAGPSALNLVCECARPTCVEPLVVPHEVYTHVREHRSRFLVASGHEEPAFEQVVERHPAFLVVEKQGAAAEAADEYL
ncbi:MAG TPA: hypothetical protein VFJ91_03695 [Gaiellaceae bacterium]|nr:hypothetical protein [Gaiellaceae bacterium]